MRILDVKVRLPFFSIKHIEAYQVGISYLSLMPSTLVGAIGYGLGLAGLCKGDKCREASKGIVRKAREYFTKNDVAIRFPVILKRMRGVLEGKYLSEKSKTKSKKSKTKSKTLYDVYAALASASDAMVREYIFSGERQFVLIGDLDKLKKAIYLIDRFGDSESLAAIVSVEEIEVNKCESNEVNTVIKADIWSMIGSHVITYGTDENWDKRLFVFPFFGKDNKVYYSPIRVKDRVMCDKDKRIMIPAGDDW